MRAVEPVYFRRRPSRRALLRRRRELDALLYARRWPADYWAAVEAANSAFAEQDDSWIEFPSGRRVTDSPS